MNTKEAEEDRPLVIACECPNYVSRLLQRAVLELAGKNRVNLAEVKTAKGPKHIRQSVDGGSRVIAVDGCHENCIRKELTAYGLKVEFYLNLSDLAIEEKQDQPLDPEDLELVQDAILASATRTKDPFPRFNCGCCS